MGRIKRAWPTGNYGTILADPPWPLRGGRTGKAGYSKTMSPDVQYPLMSVSQIASLRVLAMAMPDSHLWLWVPNGFLPQGLAVMNAWGFRYVNNVAWFKSDNRLGLGQYIRNKHELCLFGVRGRPPYAQTLTEHLVDEQDAPVSVTAKRVTVVSAFQAPRTAHSAKPPNVHEMAEAISPGPRIELFARSRRKGWDAWGNQL